MPQEPRLAFNAVIPNLTAEEAEQLYWDMTRYMGESQKEQLTRLFITLRQTRDELTTLKKEQEKS